MTVVSRISRAVYGAIDFETGPRWLRPLKFALWVPYAVVVTVLFFYLLPLLGLLWLLMQILPVDDLRNRLADRNTPRPVAPEQHKDTPEQIHRRRKRLDEQRRAQVRERLASRTTEGSKQ